MIPGDNKECCYVCGRYGNTERHHIFGGSDRNASEKYDLTCHLCTAHHTGHQGVHGKDGARLQSYLHQVAQEYFEEVQVKLGLSQEEARDKFRSEFRKSYL